MHCFSGFAFCVLLAVTYASACTLGDFKSDPEDCSCFYECIGQDWIKLKCSPGLMWNDKIKNCDYPENVDCDTTGSTTEGTTPATTKPTETTTGTTEVASSTTEVVTSTTESGSTTEGSNDCNCPAEDDPEHDILCSNPSDCGSFYKCFQGKPSLIKCPPGQEWAQELERCDWPSIANCHENSRRF